MRLSVLRPLNRAVNYQASGSIRRLNSLAANRVFQTEAYNLQALRFGGRSQERWSHCNLCAKPQSPRAFWSSPAPRKPWGCRELRTKPPSLRDSGLRL